MQERHERKRETIISTALKEWGKSHFRETSLSSLAKSMGLTKPALYRYFRNKEELNQAIDKRVRDEYCRLGRNFLERVSFPKQAPYLDLEHAFRLYIDIHLRFFCEHPDSFYYFVLSALKEPFLKHAELKGIHGREIHRFGKLLEESNGTWASDDAAKILRYIFSTCSFWIHAFLHFRDGLGSDGTGLKEHRSLSKEQSDSLVHDVSLAALFGLGGEGFQDNLPFESMERECRVRADEMPERNRIFESISEVVAEDGLGRASLEKIAQKAGMTKSSLYFYFRNKDDMLGSMLRRERDRLDTIFEDRSRLYKSIEEKIYSRFLVTASYHINNMTLMTAFTWFHYQGILANLRPPSRHALEAVASFLDEAVDSGRLKCFSLEPFHILFYMNSLIFNEILGNARTSPPLPLKLEDMRSVFRYFSRGILGGATKE